MTTEAGRDAAPVGKGATVSTVRLCLSPREFDAVVFDLDGVVTDTARVHAMAWKRLFDGLLAEIDHGDTRPFDLVADYQGLVDGKPRLDGITSFLDSRNISLPHGEPGDSVHKETVCGLANRKNLYFRQALEEGGVDVFASTVALIEGLRERGVRIAVVSASRNCKPVLAAAGLRHLFEVLVDGEDAAEFRLPGKPDPALFLEAAERLGVVPARAVVVEDASAGVAAGRRGGFGLVIGVERGGTLGRLLDAGADVEVEDLAEIALPDPTSDAVAFLPDALDAFDRLRPTLAAPELAVFLDYDGTLTPIVADPDRALLDPATRRTLRALAALARVAILTGRDLAKIRELVGLDEIVYAASHGYDIQGEGDDPLVHSQGEDFLPALDAAEAALRERVDDIAGARIERKRFAITVHFRGVAARDHAALEEAVDGVLAGQDRLRKSHGKKIFELQPDIDWHKGKALFWLLERLGLDRPEVGLVFIGDDVTDEDAFREMRARRHGIGIVVQDEPADSAAGYSLADADAVARLLARIVWLRRHGGSGR